MEENNQNTNTPPAQTSIPEPIRQAQSKQSRPPQKVRLKLPVLISIIFLIIVGTVSATYLFLNNSNKQKACTLDVKICPDGSAVGRTGPKCEFASCPTPIPNPTANWKTYTNPIEKFSFKYPPDWNLENKSSVTNGVPPELSKTIVQGDKPALISILKFNSSEYGSEDLKNFAPFTYREFEINQNTYVLIAYTYQIGASATQETKNAAIEVLDSIASTFEFTE